MMTASVMTTGVNAVVMALTPIQRWQAARRLESSFVEEHWLILTGVAVIIILTVLFVVVSYSRTAKKRKIANKNKAIEISRTTSETETANQLFFEYADRMGLSRRECEILLDIAARTTLKRNESIFTMVTAFERGATKIIEETLARQGAQTSRHLSAELSALREKLGFQKRQSTSVGSAKGASKPTSRQIPTGKKLHVTRRKIGDLTDIESTVIENNDVELTVELTMSLDSKPGELWCVRYYFGASIWEFETSAVSCDGNILILNHSDNVRFVNRRRFLRVPVSKPTFIARFPFAKTLPDNDSNKKGSGAEQDSADAPGNTWGPPDFVPATVTELAGPGLRVEAPLEVKVGDRVLVILKLNEEDNQDSSPQKTGRTTPLKVVEDIGEVRHTKATENGFSIAVELTGLSDTNVNELIRATNAASVKAGAGTHDVPEPASVQGI